MKALIAGSFDPITNGHLDIIARASKMFSEVFVVVGNNSAKKYTFPSKVRKSLVWSAVMHNGHKNVQVMEFDGLLAQFMYHHNINVLVRGVRNTSDFQEELTLAHVNNDLKGIETVFLPTTPELANVSSSMVKAIVKEYGSVQDYVPLEVKYELDRTVAGNVYVGVVGGIGAGKSTICQQLVESTHNANITVTADRSHYRAFHINMDKLGHSILEGTSPFSLHAREMIVEYFGKDILAEDTSIDRKKLGPIVFSDQYKLNVLNEIMKKPLEHVLYEEIRTLSTQNPGYRRIFFIEGAALDTGSWAAFYDNHIIDVICADDIRKERIKLRDGLSDKAIQSRMDAQLDPKKRIVYAEDRAEKAGYGYFTQVDTSTGEPSIPIETLVNILKSELIG